jgi:sulfur carrier protein ThiS
MSPVLLERQRTNSITVKIVTMGKGITNYVGEESLTLGRLLEELGVNGQMDVRVNGATVEKTYRLTDADQVLIVPKIRGGSL